MNLFQETLKYLKKDEKKDNHYYLIEPHLLYLSEAQSNSYINVTKNDQYFNSFHYETLELIHSNLGKICGQNDSFSLIDLGPGYPDKSLPIARYMQSKGSLIDYYPIDISASFLQLAEKEMSSHVLAVTPICARFEECQPFIPSQAFAKTSLLMMGITFMNFDPNLIIPLLKSIAGKEGRVMLSTELITENNSIKSILSSYQIKECEEFTFGPLKNLGLDRNSVNYLAEFRNSRVETKFLLSSPFKMPGIQLKEGDIITTAISYRYSLDDLKILLGKYFKKFDLCLSKSKKTALTICFVG